MFIKWNKIHLGNGAYNTKPRSKALLLFYYIKKKLQPGKFHIIKERWNKISGTRMNCINKAPMTEP